MRLHQAISHVLAQITVERWNQAEQFAEIRVGKTLQARVVFTGLNSACPGRLRERFDIPDDIAARQAHYPGVGGTFRRKDLERAAIYDVKRISRLSSIVEHLSLSHVPNPGQLAYSLEFRTFKGCAKSKKVAVLHRAGTARAGLIHREQKRPFLSDSVRSFA